MHVDTNSHKLKIDKNFSGGHGQKWVWPVRSWDSKINCISKMNRSNALTFCMLVLIQENWQVRDRIVSPCGEFYHWLSSPLSLVKLIFLYTCSTEVKSRPNTYFAPVLFVFYQFMYVWIFCSERWWRDLRSQIHLPDSRFWNKKKMEVKLGNKR